MKQVVFKPNHNKCGKVPVEDLPEGTIFCLHSVEDTVYQRVKGFKRKGGSVCAIELGGCGWFNFDDYKCGLFEKSTDYTIITDFSQLAFEERNNKRKTRL